MSDTATGTVFIVDDDATVRRSVARLLKSVDLSVETFDSAAAFLQRRPAEHPACAVLDVRMPGVSGLDLQEKMGEAGLDVPIIFMTGHGTVPMSVRAMKAGAVDFLEKPFEEQQLLDAVNQALEQDRRSRRRSADLEAARERLATLTPREREVFELVVTGLLNKQVAGELGTSEKTVKVHRGRVMRKMAVDSLAELVRLAERLGIGAEG